ncbi:MAG: glycerol-3-phosphate 1-O-acyltransferase PlsY [Gammaproteobacteria bacterium]|nr:glycerol-3-phosphate 1-O-acyltransferase PlsY [Gammaproteobacteria bacterium]
MPYLLPVLAYLIGSVSSAILIARIFRLTDPRAVGSGNPGATNILRQGNKTAALLTLLGDVLKGVIPVVIARLVTGDPVVLALTGGAAFLGHVFPVFFGFRGGKGVATGLGVYLGLGWPVGLSLVACWLIVAAVFRYSSLAAIVTAALSPLAAAYWLREPAFIVMAVVLAAALLWRHRENFGRLLRGQEDRIRLKSKKPAGD